MLHQASKFEFLVWLSRPGASPDQLGECLAIPGRPRRRKQLWKVERPSGQQPRQQLGRIGLRLGVVMLDPIFISALIFSSILVSILDLVFNLILISIVDLILIWR